MSSISLSHATEERPGDQPVVYVVDDEPLMRASLCRLLRSAGVSAHPCPSAEHFLSNVAPHTPGCVVLDIRMPGMDGLQVQEELQRRQLLLPIIIISGYAEIPHVVQSLKGGAVDFLEKPFQDELILERVRQALDLHRTRLQLQLRRRQWEEKVARLTPREQQIMSLLAAGKTSKMIAAALHISPKTADIHKARVLEKLKINNAVELATRVTEFAGTEGESPPPLLAGSRALPITPNTF